MRSYRLGVCAGQSIWSCAWWCMSGHAIAPRVSIRLSLVAHESAACRRSLSYRTRRSSCSAGSVRGTFCSMEQYRRSLWYKGAAALGFFNLGWLTAGVGLVFSGSATPWPLWHVWICLGLAFATMITSVVGRTWYRAWSKSAPESVERHSHSGVG
jgi:hypothetical protein